MAKRITLDELARMVMDEFRNVRTEFGGQLKAIRTEMAGIRTEMTEGFASANRRLDEPSTRFDQIERKLDSTIEPVDTHDRRIEALEKR